MMPAASSCKLQAAGTMYKCPASRQVIAGLLLCVIAAGIADAQRRISKPTPTKFQISGVLLNATNEESVPGAVVEIAYTGDRDQREQAITDDNGRFIFRDLVAGKYALAAAARGFRLQTYNQHEGFSTAIVTGPGLHSENLIFHLQPDGAIQGRVSDEYDDPVIEANVMLFYDALD